NADGCLTATGFPHDHHIGFSSSHRSPQILFLSYFQNPLAFRTGTYARDGLLPPEGDAIATAFAPFTAFALQAGLLPRGLYMKLVQQFVLLLQEIEFVCHQRSLLTLSGHATAHPFSRFRARVITTDC
ncbi:hypothetical protein AWS43_25850, partial [Enterobacter hormaechei subsp. steigerwaltii]